jgi:formate hydrogenlyase subunit 6/NADH:ubiquinone oxidoreductase subunit I
MPAVRPTLSFDTDKCTHPEECLLCVKACPRKCIGYMQAETPPPGQAPTVWKLVSAFMVTCDLCTLCVESCPKGAIRIFS